MQPSPRAVTSRLLFPSLRFCIVSHPLHKVMRAMTCGGGLVMLPSNSPVFLRVSRLHDELIAGQLECARQVFTDKGPHQCALNVEGEGVSAFVDLIGAKGSLVAALRVLHRRSAGPWLRVPIHHLDRRVAVARVDKQPGTVSPVNPPVCTFLLEPR